MGECSDQYRCRPLDARNTFVTARSPQAFVVQEGWRCHNVLSGDIVSYSAILYRLHTDHHRSATVISIIRLQFLITFARTQNPMWDQQNITKWSAIEIAVGVVCSCIPSIRVILVRILPRTFSSSNDSKRRNYYHSTEGKSSKLSGRSRGQSDVEGTDKVIHCTTTFELNRTHKDDDEVELVPIR
jgi:hypothetical protein